MHRPVNAVLCALIVTLMPVLSSAEAPASRESLPVAFEQHAPFAHALAGPERPARPAERGPQSTIEPGLYQRLKEEALTDPEAEIPDQIISLVVTQGKTGSTLSSFAGLNDTESRGSDGAFRPPDTTVGRSGFRVLEGTNSALRLFTLNGTALQTKSLNSFFGSDAAQEAVLFDPRVLFDRLGPDLRFYVVALQRNNAARTGAIYLAVSRSPNPDNLDPASWCRYKINSVRDGGTTWADFPMVGIGADAFLVSSDQFSFPTLPSSTDYFYKYGIVRAFKKQILSNNSASCPSIGSSLFVLDLPGTVGLDQRLGHVQPAVHITAPTSFPGTTNPVYMVSTRVPPSAVYRVWRVRNVGSGAPTLGFVDVSSTGTYRMPAAAKQPPGGVNLDLNDTRVLQVAASGDTLWATHVTSCTQPTGFSKPCIRVLRFFVSDNVGSPAALLQQDVTLASPDTEVDMAYFFPGVAITNTGASGIVFLASSPTFYQSAAFTVKSAVDALYSPATVFSLGDCARASARLGDYVGAQTHPSSLASFWLAGESAASLPTGCYWKTTVMEVSP